MTNDRISDIRARCEAATPGPWKTTYGADCRAFITTPNEQADFKLYNHADAAFIAHAREDIPYLLSQLAASQRRERAAVEDMKLIVDAVREEHCDETCCFACKFDCDTSITDSGAHACECPGFERDDCFEWRGPQDEKGETT